MSEPSQKANLEPGRSIFHDFDCTHDPCRCTDDQDKGEPMQTYIFTVAITGKDVQDIAAKVHDDLIDKVATEFDGGEYDGIDVHVTESVRVTPGN